MKKFRILFSELNKVFSPVFLLGLKNTHNFTCYLSKIDQQYTITQKKESISEKFFLSIPNSLV